MNVLLALVTDRKCNNSKCLSFESVHIRNTYLNADRENTTITKCLIHGYKIKMINKGKLFKRLFVISLERRFLFKEEEEWSCV